MSTIGISDDDKDEFDRLQPDDMTQGEFVAELLSVYRQQQNGGVDMERMIREITEHIDSTTAPKAELAAYRGTKDAIEE